MFAVILHKGKQYKVNEGQSIRIDRVLGAKKDGGIKFQEVILVTDEDKVELGTPTIKNAVVEGTIIDNIRDKKVAVVKFHAKKRYKRNLGHKQSYTLVKITKIKLKNEK